MKVCVHCGALLLLLVRVDRRIGGGRGKQS
jgi:hypothetical protein